MSNANASSNKVLSKAEEKWKRAEVVASTLDFDAKGEIVKTPHQIRVDTNKLEIADELKRGEIKVNVTTKQMKAQKEAAKNRKENKDNVLDIGEARKAKQERHAKIDKMIDENKKVETKTSGVDR